jgi:hypothetical protein
MALVPDVPLCVVCNTNPRFATLARCKPCVQRQAAEDRQAREEVQARAAALASERAAKNGKVKRCKGCKTEKPLTEFARHLQAKDGRLGI